jgi:osmoprotectant transport system permease protein
MRAGGAALLPGLLLLAAVLAMPMSGPVFHDLFPALERPVYVRAGFGDLLVAHLALVLGAGLVVALFGIGLGVLVTRPAGRDLAPLVDAATAVGQTFPPVAILALAVPALGYGAWPTFLALAVYGLLPVVESTAAGLRMIDPAVLGAADGIGFGPAGRLLRVELPLAAPVILGGLRTATVIAVGTATIGSTIGADTLGAPIIEGLSGSNPAYVIQGAILVGLLALFLDACFVALLRAITAPVAPPRS